MSIQRKTTGRMLKWGMILIGLQAVYLILELAFNSRLVDSATVSDPDYFEHLAHVGRVLSGIGGTLLAFGLLSKWKTKLVYLSVLAHILAAAVVFPSIYYGQEKLVDALVDSSTAEQRVHAQYIALLKRGLATNAVVFKDVEFTQEDIERPEAKTFINTIGFAVFFAPDYIQSVAENSDRILNHLATRQANELLPDAYAGYLTAREDVTKLSERYNEVNREFEEGAQEASKQARDIWAQTYASLQEQWAEYQSDDRRAKLQEGLDQLQDRLELYFLARGRCTGRHAETCLTKLNAEYDAAVSAQFGKSIAPEYWCKPIAASSATVLQGSRFVEAKQDARLDCSAQNRDYIEARFLELNGVSAVGYDNFSAFMASAEVAQAVRERLAEQGISMPETYRLRSHESFIKGVEYELTKKLAAAFTESAETELGIAIEPRLSSEAFLLHPAVQKPLRQSLGLDAGVDPVGIDLSQRAFRDDILVPQIERNLAKERARLLARTEFFADGEPYAEDGKTYVRSVLIPPIAMGLSLLFGLLNLASFGAAMISRMKLPKVAAKAGKLVFMLVVIVGPLVASSQIASSAPFQKIVNETQESLGVGRYYVVWLTSLQPVVYPLGAGLADLFNLFEPQS